MRFLGRSCGSDHLERVAEEISKIGCSHLCQVQKQPLAIVGQEVKLKPKYFSCSCANSLSEITQLFRNNTHQCTNEVYLTKWATNLCQYADYLNPGSPRLPMVGLLTARGSGTTWTQSLVQQLTGVFSGSVYSERNLLNRGVLGERKAFNTTRTTFIKTHLIHHSPSEQSKRQI